MKSRLVASGFVISLVVLSTVIALWVLRSSNSSLPIVLVLSGAKRFALLPLAAIGLLLSSTGLIGAIRSAAQRSEILFGLSGILLNGILVAVINAY